MAKDKTTVRFWLRKDCLNLDGTAPVHLVYQIQGQRKYHAIPDIKLLEVNWHVKDQKAIVADKKSVREKVTKEQMPFLLSGNAVKELNDKLASWRTDVKRIEDRFKLDQITFSPQ